MKIIIENSNLKNDIIESTEEDYAEKFEPITLISLEKVFGIDEGTEVDITFRGVDNHPYYISNGASLTFTSNIGNDDKYIMYISLKNFNILNNLKPEFFEMVDFARGQRLELKYNIDVEENIGDSPIEIEETTIPLYVDGKEKYDTRLKLSVGGTVSNPIINAVVIIEVV